MSDDHQKCKEEDAVRSAGNEVSINKIELEQPLDKIDIKILLQKCLRVASTTCLYCNHARRISVNGKQLGLHAIAKHRFTTIVKSINAEELMPESFNDRIKECFVELGSMFFSLDDTMNEDKKPFRFECFQCRYSTTVLKDLYNHNRKMHTNAVLFCSMCKTNWNSYSELLCHLCPGTYSETDVKFKCFICINEVMPSAFQLLVHLRKKHNMCDVCLEINPSQSKLATHVWKHKQAHLCYRCGVAYKNKQDINKHLFWKHGTESVECKRCLTRKWPHVYHFCLPPASFPCDECDLTFSLVSKLRVHKRSHTNELPKPHASSEEENAEKLISKRLLAKDEVKHQEPLEQIKEQEVEDKEQEVEDEVQDNIPDDLKTVVSDNKPEEDQLKDADKPKPKFVIVNKPEVDQLKDEDKPKPKIDIYDLPPLNLSESDSSDSANESAKPNITKPDTKPSSSLLVNIDELILDTSQDDIFRLPDAIEGSIDFTPEVDNEHSPVPENTVLDVWNDFKTYQKNICPTVLTDVGKEIDEFAETDSPPVALEVLRDHDYCLGAGDNLTEADTIQNIPPSADSNIEKSADHDNCTSQVMTGPPTLKEEVVNNPKETPMQASARNSSSDSGSSSDSSSSRNSSSSSSGSSTSSSDSSESDSSTEEGRRKQQVRREERRRRRSQARNDPIPKQPTVAPHALPIPKHTQNLMGVTQTPLVQTPPSTDNSATRALKRKRVPKKVYGNSSDQENERKVVTTPNVKIRKTDLPSPSPALIVPPLKLKTSNITPVVPPTTIRMPGKPRVMRRQQFRLPLKSKRTPRIPKPERLPPPKIPPIVVNPPPIARSSGQASDPASGSKSDSDSHSASHSGSDSSTSDASPPKRSPKKPSLYCYCRCPHDEVSEMIGCDADDCAIEWFHFECVNIMVAPKGKWFCPECRKKNRERRDKTKQ